MIKFQKYIIHCIVNHHTNYQEGRRWRRGGEGRRKEGGGGGGGWEGGEGQRSEGGREEMEGVHIHRIVTVSLYLCSYVKS